MGKLNSYLGYFLFHHLVTLSIGYFVATTGLCTQHLPLNKENLKQFNHLDRSVEGHRFLLNCQYGHAWLCYCILGHKTFISKPLPY